MGTRPGSPSAAIASPSQEHCGSPEVLEQIYRCNPILRYTSSPLYAPLLPFPYGSLDQSGEGRAGGTKPGPTPRAGGSDGQAGCCAGWAGAGLGPVWPRVQVWCLSAGEGGLGKPTGLLTPIPYRSPRPPQLHHAAR